MMKFLRDSYRYKSIAIISENLGKLCEDGINIIKSLELLEELPLKKEYKGSLKVISDEIQDGRSLSESFGKYEKLYPPLFLDLLGMGEKCGDINKVMKISAKYYNNIHALINKIRSAMSYPMFLVCLMMILILVFMFFILPTFSDLFKSSGKEVPTIYKAMLDLNNFVREKPIIFIIYCLCWGGGIIYILTNICKGKLNKILNKVSIGRSFIEYECLLHLSIILSSGVGIQKGIIAFNKESGSPLIRNIMNEFERYILNGHTITNSMVLIGVFSKYSISMVSIGEESGRLEEKLESICVTLQGELDNKLKKISSNIEPIFITGISLFVGFFAITLLGPFMETITGGIGR
ncbi:MAG: type II secretion system F family protein [Clostridium sp.]